MEAAHQAPSPWFGTHPRGHHGPHDPAHGLHGHAPWKLMAGGRGRRGPGPFGFGGPGGFPFGGPPFGGPGGPGFWRGPRVRRGDVRAAALALLAEQRLNGYQIIQEIGERSGRVWRPSPGSVYPALAQLEDEGLIVAAERDGRRAFDLTAEGRAYVESHKEELAAPWDSVTESVSDERMELRQVIGQVMAAFGQVMHAGTPAQIAEAGRVLADTRRALYRILADGEAEGRG